MRDKQRERSAIEAALGPHAWSVINSESPDFLCSAEGTIVLGVEVTELWLNESEARLARVDGYSLRLLEGGPPMHRDDLLQIHVEEADIIDSATGERRPWKGIFREGIPYNRSARRLTSAIKAKMSLVPRYRGKCPAVDIVVADAQGLFEFEEFSRLWWPLGHELRESGCLRGDAREVYLVTRKGRQEVSIPLRANLFAEDLLTTGRRLRAQDPARASGRPTFGRVLKALAKMGHGTCPVSVQQDRFSLWAGACQFTFAKGGVMAVEDARTLAERQPQESQALGVAMADVAEDQALPPGVAPSGDALRACLSLVFPFPAVDA